MKILLLFLTFCGAANATSWAPLEFPQAPIAEKLLQHNGLANAAEDILLGYLESHWDSLGYWIPDGGQFVVKPDWMNPRLCLSNFYSLTI